MPTKHAMRDIIVLIPGITGSVLQYCGHDIWSFPTIVGPALRGQSDRFALLRMDPNQDDPDLDDLGDGIRATRLMEGIHGWHHLMLGQGYRQIIEKLTSTFILQPGSLQSVEPANFFPFPYDWRRDNRAAARQLKRLIDTQLHLWRREHHEAKVIFITHSMGGLVARYYLEVLDGWEDCRALFTIGTPHRGSLDALNSLVNGKKIGLANVTDLVRTFTSVYQLLPIYPTVTVDGVLYRVAETDRLAPDIDQTRAVAARAFYQEIASKVAARSATKSSQIVPLVGIGQKNTHQSAVLDDGVLRLSRELPIRPARDVNVQWFTDGDGTVPAISAIPVEFTDPQNPRLHVARYYCEKHEWLASNRTVLRDLCEWLKELQLAPTMHEYQGGIAHQDIMRAPLLSLDIESFAQVGTPLRPRVDLFNVNGITDIGTVELEFTPTGAGTKRVYTLKAEGDGWTGEIADLPPDIYTVEARTFCQGPPAVHSIVEVFA